MWFAPLVDDLPEEYVYSKEEMELFRRDPEQLVEHVKKFDTQLNRMWPAFFTGSALQQSVREKIEARMRQLIRDERLLQGQSVSRARHPTTTTNDDFVGFTPQFAVGCRRITPGEAYLRAIQQPNVSVHFTPVTKIAPNGVIGGDGILREADTIICATGFDVSFRPRFPIVGKNGVCLSTLWRGDQPPCAYFGLTVPDMPNFMMQGGPPSPVQNGTPFGGFHAAAGYALHIIRKLQRENVRALQPKRDVVRAFVRHVDDYFAGTVFADACRSWYKDNETGRINAVWPGSALHYRKVLENPRWEDYEIEYRDEGNMFSWMGLGFVQEQVTPGADLAFYLSVDNIDPLWMREIQGTGETGNAGGGIK